MSEHTYTFEALALIQQIKRQIGRSYPFCAGNVTIYCPNHKFQTIAEIVSYFRNKEYNIVINYEKKEVKISGFCSEF